MRRSTLLQREIGRLYKTQLALGELAGSFEFDKNSRIHRFLSLAALNIDKARDQMAAERNKALDNERDRSAP